MIFRQGENSCQKFHAEMLREGKDGEIVNKLGEKERKGEGKERNGRRNGSDG